MYTNVHVRKGVGARFSKFDIMFLIMYINVYLKSEVGASHIK